MATKKKYYRHCVYCTGDDDKFIKKFGLSPSKIYQEALAALRMGVCETAGKRAVYSFKSTTRPQEQADPGPAASAQTTAPDQIPPIPPAAPPIPPTNLEPDRPGPRPVPAPTVLIVRKRPAAITDNIDDLCEPVEMTRPGRAMCHQIAPSSMLKKGLLVDAWAALPDRD